MRAAANTGPPSTSDGWLRPGITIPEIAAKMGIKQNYLYRVLAGLADHGLVVKDGRGWKPAEAA